MPLVEFHSLLLYRERAKIIFLVPAKVLGLTVFYRTFRNTTPLILLSCRRLYDR